MGRSKEFDILPITAGIVKEIGMNVFDKIFVLYELTNQCTIPKNIRYPGTHLHTLAQARSIRSKPFLEKFRTEQI